MSETELQDVVDKQSEALHVLTQTCDLLGNTSLTTLRMSGTGSAF